MNRIRTLWSLLLSDYFPVLSFLLSPSTWFLLIYALSDTQCILCFLFYAGCVDWARTSMWYSSKAGAINYQFLDGMWLFCRIFVKLNWCVYRIRVNSFCIYIVGVLWRNAFMKIYTVPLLRFWCTFLEFVSKYKFNFTWTIPSKF